MKRRKLIAVGFVALAALVFAIAAGGVSGATKAKSITVWLQVDAQSGWPDVVAAANAQFQSAHPGVERQRAVPDLADPSAEVRRDARGRQRAGRDRDGEHAR